jgi:phosphate acetyltransferase
MSDSLLVANIGGSKGTSPIILSLMEHFQKQGFPRVGYFVPIAQPKCEGNDRQCRISQRIDLVRTAFQLFEDDAEQMQGVLKQEAEELLSQNKLDELAEKIYAKFSSYKKGKDITVIEGANLQGLSSMVEVNGWLASELQAPLLMVFDCMNDTTLKANDIMNRAQIAKQIIVDKCHADLAGMILNRVPQSQMASISEEMQVAADKYHCAFAGCIANDDVLQNPHLNEVVKSLDAEFLFGNALDADVDVSTMVVAAQDVSHMFSKIEYLGKRAASDPSNKLSIVRPLVLTTPDRTDILLSLACAHASKVGPNVAGVILCDMGLTSVDEHVNQMYSSFDHIFPVYGTKYGLSYVIQKLGHIETKILPISKTKIERAKLLFNQSVNMDVISAQINHPNREGKTPKQFLHGLHEICRQHRKKIVLPEAFDRRILQAAVEITDKELADIVLLGDEKQILADCAKYNIRLDPAKCTIIDHQKDVPHREQFASIWTEERKAKGATYEKSLDLLSDRNVFGTMMVKTGMVDGMVSGAACTTAATIRPALSILKNPGVKLVSSAFLMCLPDRVLVFADCAINVSPEQEELAQIAATSADTAVAFGVDPRIAMISYSTLGSGSGPLVDKVQHATDILKREHPELKVEGPVQYDAAINPVVAREKIKGKSSEVAGRATVLVFPDLNTGNSTYKAVQQSSKRAVAIGPLLQGLARPVNDLSRGATVADIVNTVCCTAIQAIGEKLQ